MIHTHVMNATGKLDSVAPLLTDMLRDWAPRIGEVLGVPHVDITVSPFQDGAAPESGIGGYALSPFRIEILVDAERDNVARVIDVELPSVLAHEIHHCARMTQCPDQVTLADNLITEGLACHFEETVNGGHPSSLFRSIATQPWMDLYEMARPHLGATDFSFDYWFLGKAPDELPKYAGFWVGYNLVVSHAARLGLSHAEMVGLPSSHFIDAGTDGPQK